MQDFDLAQLRTFVAVADAGSLTAAAPRVFLSQSAVSEQLRKLEERAGHPLLVRGKSGAVPTPAGERLLAHARRL
ncbi:MAG: LysR family transcriptional regulator, partial [Xenophilus sp.]